MGPFNKVMETTSPFVGDEKYRQHDVGYGKLSNPYFNFNKYDQQLLNAPVEGAADYVGKGVFAAKQFLDVFNTPSLYKGGYAAPKKNVDSYTGYDASKVPFRESVTPKFKSGKTTTKIPFDYGRRYFPSSDVAPRRPYGPKIGGGARVGSGGGRKHDYIVKYDFSE